MPNRMVPNHELGKIFSITPFGTVLNRMVPNRTYKKFNSCLWYHVKWDGVNTMET